MTYDISPYLVCISVSRPDESIVVRLRYIGIISSGRAFPSAVARARASCDGSNTASWRNRRTLCIVIRDVGEEEMMMIGYWLPAGLIQGELWDRRVE